MSTLKQRIEELSAEMPRGWKARLARHCGVKPPSVSDWASGETKSLEGDNLLKAADFFSVRPEWLASGRGQKFVAHPKTGSAIFTLDSDAPLVIPSSVGEVGATPQNGAIVIRQFDTGGGMGGGLVLKDQPGVIESWAVSQEWIAKNVRSYTAAKNLCIVTGFGDSMRPMYNPGDPLLVDIGVNSVDFDGVYFFRVADEGFVKRLQRIPGQGLAVISENTQYRDWTITKGMDFQVFGRVVKVWRGEEF